MSVISEQVKELREKAQVFEDSGCATNGIVKTFRKAADTIEELSAKLATANIERSTAYYNDGWIPCSERLPEVAQQCLVTIQQGKIRMVWKGSYMAEYWWIYGERYGLEQVTAWMPLPEPFKGEENV